MGLRPSHTTFAALLVTLGLATAVAAQTEPPVLPKVPAAPAHPFPRQGLNPPATTEFPDGGVVVPAASETALPPTNVTVPEGASTELPTTATTPGSPGATPTDATTPLPTTTPANAVRVLPSTTADPPLIASPERPQDDMGLLDKLKKPLQLGGYFWVDSGYMNRTNAQTGQYDQVALYMQGRFVLGATYAQQLGDYFALARAQLMGLVNEFAKSQYEPHALDVYVKAGHRQWWDVQVGRFLAWEVYHRGQGIELFTAEEAGAFGGPTLYWLDLTRGYMNEAGQLAVHFYPLDWLRFEVAGVYGQQNNQNNVGGRPVFVLDWKGLEVRGGYEYLLQYPQTSADKVQVTQQGYAAKVQYAFPVVTVGADVAEVWVDAIDIQGLKDTDRSRRKLSAGGFVDIDFWHNSIGLGWHHTDQVNVRGEHDTHDQAFVSYLFRLPIDGLSVKAVYGFALAHVQSVDTGTSWNNTMQSARVRVTYEFQ